jgi:hypothetical protein
MASSDELTIDDSNMASDRPPSALVFASGGWCTAYTSLIARYA